MKSQAHRAVWAVCGIAVGIIILLSLPLPAIAAGEVTASFTARLALMNVSVSGISGDSATVSWQTSDNASSQVFYGTLSHENTEDYPYYTAVDHNRVREHTLLLTGLSPSTTYHYRVESAALANGIKFDRVSPDDTFTTASVPTVKPATPESSPQGTMNYVPPLSPVATPTPTLTPTTGYLQAVMPGGTSVIRTGTDRMTVLETATLSDQAGNFVIVIPQGTKISGADRSVVERIDLAQDAKRLEDLITVPKDTVAISPVYDITAFIGDVPLSSVNFDPHIIITISYDPKDLPDTAFLPYIVTFHEDSSFERLLPPSGSPQEIGKVTGVVYHASHFAVVADVAPLPPPLPAHFTASNLVVSPTLARQGEPVSISVDIANGGAVTGSYELCLVVDGIVRETKEVTIEPNSVTTEEFEVSGLAAGQHQVKVAGLSEGFRVIGVSVSPPVTPQVNWSPIDLPVAAMLAAGLLLTFLSARRSQRS